MSYEPTTWATGDIITATKLNNIESGVQSVSSSYTPTTWATGDIITATKLNNIEQGIANAGGGGSSDFSTATVTFVNNTADKVLLGATAVVLDEGEHSCIYGIDSLADNGSYTFILYKGLNVFTCNNSDQLTVTTSGNVTYDSENDTFLITGDCTITIS